MLALALHKNSALIFTLPDGQRIEVTYYKGKSENIRVGIKAPDSVKVTRSEHEDAERAMKTH